MTTTTNGSDDAGNKDGQINNNEDDSDDQEENPEKCSPEKSAVVVNRGSNSDANNNKFNKQFVTSATGYDPSTLPLDWTQLGQPAPDPPPLIFPADVSDFTMDDVEIVYVGTAGQKITKIGDDFYTKCNPNMEQIVFRSNLIKKMEGFDGFTKLELLELYDNMVDGLSSLEGPGPSLRTLDMSYNAIRDMSPVSLCPNLTELYLANNKLKSISGLKGLSKLRKLDLGANRIRVMDEDELSGLINLEELWIGKNKITEIGGLSKLTRLRRLDVQSNRLTSIDNLSTQEESLEELYLAHNGITDDGLVTPTGLGLSFPNLTVLDLSRNNITTTEAFTHLKSIEDLWLSGNKIESFDQVAPLSKNPIETLYLEYNPVASDFEYRKKLKVLIPTLKQIDANMIVGAGFPGVGNAVGGQAETLQEQMRRLQAKAIERAAAETSSATK